MKKLIVFLIGCWIMCSIQTVSAQNETFYYGEEYQETSNWEDKTDLAEIMKNDSINTKETTLLYQIRQYFRLTGNDVYDQEKPAIAYISMIINMLLWLTSLISLILLIFAFYLIFFQKGEEGVKKAKKILVGIAIALIIMWLSRLIVNFFFEVYTTQAVKNI